MSRQHILIMAGGTGGHVFPALAVARELMARGAEVSWLGTRRGLEAEVVPAAGIAIDYISISGLRGKGLSGWLLAPWRLNVALLQALNVLRKRRPTAVLGMGGFVTGPGGVAAKLLGRQLIIHEQNAVAGLTNRLLSHIADSVLEAFPSAFSGAQVEQTGNPVRSDILGLPAPEARYASREGRIRLFVLGGSLGASFFNETLPRALAMLPEASRPEVRHQCGKRHPEATRRHYTEAGVEAELLPFIDDMAAMYEWADLVLCRAGALTVSELAAVGMPALLVPFPYAVDDHQTANGRYLAEAGAAQLLPQAELDAERLAEVLRGYCAEPEKGRAALLAMARQAHKLAKPEATQRVADICLAAGDKESME
jgi:UDP-N-acetylglucosamine--N-acetylmuramyl-(pentapeptide) pyrophosphoryl-undecaprenol N-acetylglucosamine transferase